MGSTTPSLAVYTLRIERDKLDRFREIAATQHHTVAQKIRLMVEREIDDHERQAA